MSQRAHRYSAPVTLARDHRRYMLPSLAAAHGHLPLRGSGVGLGQANMTERIAMSSAQITSGVIGGMAASATAAGTTTWATAAIPFIGPAIAGVTLILAFLHARKGPKQKVATTQIVNDVEPHLQDNLNGYFSGPRTLTSQYQALENFKAGWQWVVDHCGIPEMGEPGQRCISERDRGGTAPWCPTGTGCDWWALYYDPIANDPEVKPDPVESFFETTAAPGSGGGFSLTPGAPGGLSFSPVLIGAAALLLLGLSMGGK
jgi:hypothetical protein